MNILETKGLYHAFSGGKVLFDVNLQIKEGETSWRLTVWSGKHN